MCNLLHIYFYLPTYQPSAMRRCFFLVFFITFTLMFTLGLKYSERCKHFSSQFFSDISGPFPFSNYVRSGSEKIEIKISMLGVRINT